MKRPASNYLANFDSAAGMLRATANFMKGRPFSMVGLPSVLKPLARGIGRLPEGIRKQLFALGGLQEGLPPDKLDSVDADRIAEWMVSEYPEGRRYPGVMVGSSNGAAVHLCCALGIPWLPQTKLIPVRRTTVHPDEMRDEMEWGREPAELLLKANPELQLHHMHDPNQDRLMVRYISYFRAKRLRLGRAFERFIVNSVEPGGTIFLLECEKRWPVKRVGHRHFFQPGAVGGLEPKDYIEGTPRVAEFLEREESHRRAWEPPQPDAMAPEAEWGFEPALRADVERFAEQNGYRVRPIAFAEPEDMSPLVADLYRWWYRRRGMPGDRLVGESFIVFEPWWTLRTGSVPFWMKFNVDSSAEALERYLDSTEPFDDILLMIFSHGVDSVGLAEIPRWRTILDRARREGRFLGMREEAYPRHFDVFADYDAELEEIPARYPIPGPLSFAALDDFLSGHADRYAVKWEEGARPVVGAGTSGAADERPWGNGGQRDDGSGDGEEGRPQPVEVGAGHGDGGSEG